MPSPSANVNSIKLNTLIFLCLFPEKLCCKGQVLFHFPISFYLPMNFFNQMFQDAGMIKS